MWSQRLKKFLSLLQLFIKWVKKVSEWLFLIFLCACLYFNTITILDKLVSLHFALVSIFLYFFITIIFKAKSLKFFEQNSSKLASVRRWSPRLKKFVALLPLLIKWVKSFLKEHNILHLCTCDKNIFKKCRRILWMVS